MAGLTGKNPAESHKSLLRVNDDTNGIDATAENITDGEGTASALNLSDDQMLIKPVNDENTAALFVRAKAGTPLLAVDTTNSVVKAGVGQFNVLIQYAYFGATSQATTANAAGYHYPLQFNCASIGLSDASADQLNIFGNGTDPATSVTTAEASDQRASNLVSYMMYVPDNIYIDAIYSVEGADAATGDTTRFHCMSYTFTSGSTSCLTSGTLIAHSDDETNAGSEQVYLNTWNMDSNTVAAGKVLICTFEPVSVNSDYAYTVTIKYHLV